MNKELGRHIDRALLDREFALEFYNGKYNEENLRKKFPDRYKRRRILELYKKFLGDALHPLLLEVTTSEIQNRIAEEVGVKNFSEIKTRLENGESVADLISEYNLHALLAILEEDTQKRQREAHDLLVDSVRSETENRLEDEMFNKAVSFFETEEKKYFDPMTGLYSLGGLERGFAREIENFENYKEDEMLAFISFDIDSFKQVNTLLGHDGADEVLKELSNRLLSLLRVSDKIGRRSGDEFVILARITKTGLDDLLNKINTAVEEPFKIMIDGEEKEVFISLTGGVCLIDKNNVGETDYKYWSMKSDEASGFAKIHKKGEFVVSSPELMFNVDSLNEEEIEEYFRVIVKRELSRDLEDIEVHLIGVSEEKEPEKFNLLKLKQLALKNKLEASLQERIAEYYLDKLERSSKK